ncbi:SCO3242 family prenyltransferase [Streptomyces sp. NPDC055078]
MTLLGRVLSSPSRRRRPLLTSAMGLLRRASPLVPEPRAWAELLRLSALFTVPGDALAGAASLGARPNRGTALALGTSLCLYEAGMALNDWADRDEDAIDRPHRPIPSGRITPAAALTAATVLTAGGLTLAARAGRPALTTATLLTATVWSYNLHFKHTPAGPAAMATARALDLLLGAVATESAGRANPASPVSGAARPLPGATGSANPAPPAFEALGPVPGVVRSSSGATGSAFSASPAFEARGPGRSPGKGPHRPARGTPHPARAAATAALTLGAHTYAVTSVSRHETQGGAPLTPLAALAATLALGVRAAAVRPGGEPRAADPPRKTLPTADGLGTRPAAGPHGADTYAGHLLRSALAAKYLRTAATPYLHAALNPSPPLTQRAVGGGIRAMIPLQAALAARAGHPAGRLTALALMGLVPLARKLARKVSPT